MLTLASGVCYVHEPFNPRSGLQGTEVLYPYAAPSERGTLHARLAEGLYERRVGFKTHHYSEDSALSNMAKRVLGSRHGLQWAIARNNPLCGTYLVKDPIGCLMTEHLAVRFGMLPVIIVRHPLAVLASIRRLGWTMNLAPIRSQAALAERHLQDLPTCDDTDSVELYEAAHLWRILNLELKEMLDRNPEWRARAITHEQICAQPVDEFRELYRVLGLRWNARVQRSVVRATSSDNPAEPVAGRPQTLRRNSSDLPRLAAKSMPVDERRAVFEITWPVAKHFYTEASFYLDD